MDDVTIDDLLLTDRHGNMSKSTLQRDMLALTGMSSSQWEKAA